MFEKEMLIIKDTYNLICWKTEAKFLFQGLNGILVSIWVSGELDFMIHVAFCVFHNDTKDSFPTKNWHVWILDITPLSIHV